MARVTDQEVANWRGLLQAGHSITQIARVAGRNRRTVALHIGTGQAGSREREQRNVRVNPDLWDAAADVALGLGLSNRGGRKLGGGNVGEMIEMIGAGHLIVVERPRGRSNGVERKSQH